MKYLERGKTLVLMVMMLLCSAWASAQNVTLSGVVKDKKNGEDLIGATVFIQGINKGAATNLYGFYSLSVPKGDYTVTFSYTGYANIERKVNLQANTKVNIDLEEATQTKEAVEVVANKLVDQTKTIEMSVAKVEMKTIAKMPALLGEVDLVRSIQLLPGVSTVGEGATGFNVRGGAVDQNLIILDEAPLFNSSHLLGFFSIFNPDAVRDVKLYKGGIPAQYGGRLSSVLDVRLKEGNNKRLAVNGGVGLIFSRLSVEAPIKKDKGSFIIAGRRSYGDLFLKLSSDENLKNTQLYFYDLTAKANYTLDERNKVFISGYFGKDVVGLNGFGFNYGNTTASARWNHLFNDKMFMNLTAYYSDYSYGLAASQERISFNWDSRIRNYSFKPDFTYYANSNNTISFGAQVINYITNPGKIYGTGSDRSFERELAQKYGTEAAIYIANEQKVNERLTLQYGLRYSYYAYLGPGESYTLRDTIPGVRKPVVEPANSYKSGEIIADYGNLEPRFSAKYELNEKSSVKASYNRMTQYLQLVSNTTAVTPVDVYTLASKNIKPQIADQLALGYFRNFGPDRDYEFSIEGFYKVFQNQTDYVPGADLLINEKLEADLLFGDGRAYGLEFYLKKNTGKFTGWISYTLSRTERQVTGLNAGDWYPSRFDKTHNLSVVAMYDLNEKWSFGSNLQYSTGVPLTFPSSRFSQQGIIVPSVDDNKINNYRVPYYFRIDLSATWQLHKRIEGQGFWKNYESNLVFSLYNVLGRRNPFGIYFQADPKNSQQTQAVQFSVFGSIIPGVTYNFNF